MGEKELIIFKEGIKKIKSKQYYNVSVENKPVNGGLWFKDPPTYLYKY